MTRTIVLDADFLSAFLKIEQLGLVREFFQVESLHVPQAVYRELAATALLGRLTSMDWIDLTAPDPAVLERLSASRPFLELGAGEREAIALTIDRSPGLLLMNDRIATRVAEPLGIEVVSIPAFLLACRQSRLLGKKQVTRLVQELKEKDHYGFSGKDLSKILAD